MSEEERVGPAWEGCRPSRPHYPKVPVTLPQPGTPVPLIVKSTVPHGAGPPLVSVTVAVSETWAGHGSPPTTVPPTTPPWGLPG